jgi:phosphoesterase RecJ-like protein
MYISKQIHNHLLGSNKIVIVPHQNPDGDAIGSASAMAEYLRQLGKQPTIFCLTPAPAHLHFLPHTTTMTNDQKIFLDETIESIVILDSGDLRYAGIHKHITNHSAQIINIDHHATNEKYGHFNLVDSTASSTTEILYRFFKHNNIRLTRDLSTALLTGLLTDTGNFTNSATSISAITTAGELLRAGANLSLINNRTVKNISFNYLKLLGDVLGRLEKNEKMNMVHTYLKKDDYEKYGLNDNMAEGISNFLLKLEEADISLFIRETNDDKIKGSFRSTKNEVDVSILAKKFGGGGHKKAAGFTTTGSIQQVLDKILKI